MSVFVQQQGTFCDFSGGDSWVILSPIEQSIKRKIEAVGTPLKDWDINIYRGVLTGYNDAFIITTSKRDEILSNCQNEDERKRTAELIRPILRGRDIKRYGYEWANLYLIATFPARHYNIDSFPAVKEYLLSFAYDSLLENGNDWVAKNYLAEFCKQKLEQTGQEIIINGKYVLDPQGHKEKSRKRTNNKWFETQDSISYWEEFMKPKIIYREIGFEMDTCIAPANWFVNNKLYLVTGDDIEYLLAFFNSKAFNKIILASANLTGGKGVDFMEKVKVPREQNLMKAVQNTHDERQIDALFNDFFELTEAEKHFLSGD